MIFLNINKANSLIFIIIKCVLLHTSNHKIYLFWVESVPVPTPPQSVRSTETIGSGHGTTIQVNLPSASDFKDADPNQEVMVSAAHENDVCNSCH